MSGIVDGIRSCFAIATEIIIGTVSALVRVKKKNRKPAP